MEELKEFFRQNGKGYSKGSDQKWKDLKNLMMASGEKVGAISCGGCRQKMYDWIMSK